MSDVTMNIAEQAYGGLSFEEASPESQTNTRANIDLAPARSLVDYLLAHPGEVARFTVDTGELVAYNATTKSKKTGKDLPHPNRGRGKNELKETRLIKQAAKEQDKGARVSSRHLNDGKTMLTVELTKAATMSENAKNALDKYRADVAAAKAVAEAEATNGAKTEPTKAPAVAKAPATKAPAKV
jgi:hypothetical protein